MPRELAQYLEDEWLKFKREANRLGFHVSKVKFYVDALMNYFNLFKSDSWDDAKKKAFIMQRIERLDGLFGDNKKSEETS